MPYILQLRFLFFLSGPLISQKADRQRGPPSKVDKHEKLNQIFCPLTPPLNFKGGGVKGAKFVFNFRSQSCLSRSSFETAQHTLTEIRHGSFKENLCSLYGELRYSMGIPWNTRYSMGVIAGFHMNLSRSTALPPNANFGLSDSS